ncbi:hypothetical protein [Vulcanisaeta sp. JCM 14467]|uniref:hypothetical protein n=1 Tax=Vulcanisaeta sp. JCM 14467 TaxID=1295370 RepID=UPI000A6D3B16|nr:hypothetical protein [Vulcanisaeta sp. JCM 14467]
MARIPATLSLDKIIEVARALASLDLRRSDAFDTRFYPPKDADVEDTYNYFLAMVAIDHRTNIGDRQFTRRVGGEVFTGSDLLWRLGMEMFNRDSSFFSPINLMRLDPAVVRDWLVGDYGPVWIMVLGPTCLGMLGHTCLGTMEQPLGYSMFRVLRS